MTELKLARSQTSSAPPERPDRRGFLKRSALGIAAIAIAPGVLLNASEAWGVEV